MSDEVIDYSGNFDENEFNNEDDDNDFISDEEREMIELAESQFFDEEENNLIAESTVYHISTGISAIVNLQKKIDELVDKSSKSTYQESLIINDEIMEISKKIYISSKTVNDLIMGFYKFTDEHNIFWSDCSFEVYKNHLETIKNKYCKYFPDSKSIDFYRHEYFSIIDPNKNPNFIHDKLSTSRINIVDYKPYLTIPNQEFFNINRQRKLDYITDTLEIWGLRLVQSSDGKIVFVGYDLDNKPIHTPKDFGEVEDLSLANLPSFKVEHRYKLFQLLGFENAILKIDTQKKSKDALVALILGISLDNAKKLLSGTYKKTTDRNKDKAKDDEILEEIQEYLYRNKIKL